MTLSSQDRRLRRAHAEFERAARELPDPVRFLAGAVRASALVAGAAIAARRGPDPIGLQPRVLRR